MATYGVLGTGTVGQTLAGKLAALGHEVRMGTRDVAASQARTDAGWGAEPLSTWLEANPSIELATFHDAMAASDILINATSGSVSVDVLALGDPADLDGKILIDIGNPLDFSGGDLDLTVGITDSLGETLQRTYPSLRVVKTLNTVTSAVMVDPASLGGGDHTMFVAGNHDAAKATVTQMLHSFGWRDVVDLGDISGARGMEAMLILWLRSRMTLNNAMFNVKLVR
ncbi:MAG TPA: NAD(P)-binding domain-containing protein [Actinomycetota bacterium]|nr:NAD(P)-binding domain-containing protein [Actinomycetota bacterium]